MKTEYKTRLELESFLRETYKDKNTLADFCINNLNLETIYKYSAPYIVLLHWAIDRLIKGDLVKIPKPPIMNMLTMRWKSELEKGERLKINAYAPTDDYLAQFGKRLAGLIANNQALIPGESEGIDLESLNVKSEDKKVSTKAIQLDELEKRIKILEDRFSAMEDILMNK